MKFKILDNKFSSNNDLEIESYEIDDSKSSHSLHLFNRYVRNKFRFSTASTKTRSEVKCTTAKAYKQKGTGNARRGANSTPLRRGGGVIFGPKPRSFDFKLNKKVIKQAHRLVLSKIADKSFIIDESFDIKKTSQIDKLFKKNNMNNKSVFLITELDFNLVLPFRNLNYIILDFVDNYDPELLLTANNVIFSKNAFDTFRGYANV
jgi:large subunit ribosomal protein L4